MLILPRRARWSFRVLRSFSSSVSIPIVASSTSSLGFDSYFEPNTSDQVYSNNRRIGHFIKSGDLNNALNVFDEMPRYDVVTYNLLISGHGRFGRREQAFRLYTDMVSQGIRESASTFSSVLGTCTDAGLYREGVQVQCRAVSLGFSLNMYVGSSLVDLYLRMGQDNVAVKLFDELQERNLAVWNLLLRGFCELGRVDELFGMYYRMKLDGVDPNGLSYCYWIRACSNGKLLDEGKQLHCGVVKEGWLESNVFVANALVDLYSACGSLIDAREAFEAIPVEDVISWNSIIWVYTENGLLLDGLELFARMQFWGKRPSIRSFVGFLNLASRIQNIQLGKQIHSYVVKSGFDHDASFHIQSALIDMYGKCSDIESSVFIYENGRDRNVECCNSLMTSLLHCGVIEDVVEMFGLMVDEGIGLDEVTLSTTLKALSVSAFASLGSCKLLHCCAVKSGFESDIAVSCSLIEAYARCGHVKLSCQVFDELPSPNVICFTSIIHGYARNGMGGECLHLLQEMVAKGLKPDKVTVLCVLSGCNHSGLVEEAKLLFDSMEMLYGVSPDRKHYSCMVDLLGRAGLLHEAEELLQHAPGKGDYVMWSSLLRSCRVHKNEIVGRRTVKSLLELEGKDPAILLQASNFYSEIGEFDTAMQIREFAIAQQVTRDIGHSLVEVNSRSHR
ncbi:putative tetratricopeptide-like helical domain-containing protein [Rosa chinensis]|uniref:Putative tetratricopeptide-like helical domain-containing protein n=1 Tax=Rosa chinensis TaxID=74649 RepID=A0A2P6R3D5_ROSCH|nr:pentatricopeptide repeat-containing protein At2g33680 [Rosa chinensis]PRQ40965.1 putative tetratricopeptide-like helical domain-containing protein [Rosa chinensis]